ncbi:MAG: hypothetical protein K6A90_13225 [Lachnospiraceae bacterium]|nr:hypothetical protein [Lachnospiraceae bacterium]
MDKEKDIRFFPVFFGATMGVVLEVIATLVDEIVMGNLFTDEIFAAVNLITPFTILEVFIAYLASVAGAALIVRAQGAGNKKRMSELFSQTLIVCGLCGITLTLIYVLFTPQLVRLVADDPSVYENALSYFKVMRFYPLLDMFDTFMFAYVLYRGGFLNFYTAIISRIGINVLLSWQLGIRMGLTGVGLASIISLLVALLVKLTFLFSSKHGLKFVWHLNIRDALEVAMLGFPESAISIFVVIMEFGLNTFTLKNYGAAGVAAVSVVINIFEFTFYLSEGISEYEIVSVNDSIGKDSSRSMDLAIKKTLRAALIEGAVLFGLIILASGALPEAFDIDNEETAQLAALMLKIFAPTAVFICLSRITAIFYQYTRRLPRTIILFGMAIALLPISFGMLFGRFSQIGIAVGMALGPFMAFSLMYVYVRCIKKEKLFDYTLMHLN